MTVAQSSHVKLPTKAMPPHIVGDTEQPNPWNKQVGGNHYKDCKIQPVEFIVANDLDFCTGNTIKYLVRYKVKGNIQDLEKAKHYIELMIDAKTHP